MATAVTHAAAAGPARLRPALEPPRRSAAGSFAVPQPLKVLRKTTPRRLAAAAPSQTPPRRTQAPLARWRVHWTPLKIRLLIYGVLLFLAVSFTLLGDMFGAVQAACMFIVIGYLDCL